MIETPEQAIEWAQAANELKANKVWKAIWADLVTRLDEKMMRADPTNADLAKDIVRTRQLLEAIKQEIDKYVEWGQAGEILLNELENKKKRGIFR